MVLNYEDQTIIAQTTGKGKGALAMLALSGDQALTIANSMSKLASGKKISHVPSHTIHYGQVIDKEGKHIDHVIFYIMHGPRTFTGQNVVELTCHNNPFIVEHIIAQAIEHGARPAQGGEFAKRAVLSGKIDLTQAEAINELVHANTQLALKKSLAQLEGSFSRWITTIEKQLVQALALSEASFEFIDEEVAFGNQIQEIVDRSLSTISTIKKTYDQQKQIREGIRIAIIGSVNAGKSSLFNALLNKQRAIVTNIAGTTRDSIEAGLYKNNNYWTLIDTAGLRKSEDVIEQEGIKRSFEQAQQADIILLVCDGSIKLLEQEKIVYQDILTKYPRKTILINNKSDHSNFKPLPLVLPVRHSKKATAGSSAKRVSKDQTKEFLTTSSKENKNIEKVEAAIEDKIAQLFQHIESPFLLNQRQFKLMLGLEKKLDEVKAMLQSEVQYELLSCHLNDALAHISELTGKTISEKGMDAVFREFCVGK